MRKETDGYMTFGERLAYARKKSGMPQSQLAGLAGVTQSIVSRWEEDRHKPDMPKIRKIVKALDVSEDWLIGNDTISGNRQITLTKAQQKLVADHEYIIGDAIRKFCPGNKGKDYENLYGDAAIGLCKAAHYYNKNRGPFYQIAYSFVKWAICSAFRMDYTRSQVLDTLSLDQTFSKDPIHQDDDIRTLSSLIPAPDDEWEQLEYHILVESVYQKVESVLTDQEKRAFQLWLHGENNVEIARAMGASSWMTTRQIANARKKCRALFNPDEIFS
jgi:RNA polymerase sigma factor (sigma-70 family)